MLRSTLLILSLPLRLFEINRVYSSFFKTVVYKLFILKRINSNSKN